jgi:hypothetical protein
MEQDYDYFEGRAEAELEMAVKATDPAAAKAHYLLAAMYLDRIHGSGERGSAEAPAMPLTMPARALPRRAVTASRRRRGGPA